MLSHINLIQQHKWPSFYLLRLRLVIVTGMLLVFSSVAVAQDDDFYAFLIKLSDSDYTTVVTGIEAMFRTSGQTGTADKVNSSVGGDPAVRVANVEVLRKVLSDQSWLGSAGRLLAAAASNPFSRPSQIFAAARVIYRIKAEASADAAEQQKYLDLANQLLAVQQLAEQGATEQDKTTRRETEADIRTKTIAISTAGAQKTPVVKNNISGTADPFGPPPNSLNFSKQIFEPNTLTSSFSFHLTDTQTVTAQLSDFNGTVLFEPTDDDLLMRARFDDLEFTFDPFDLPQTEHNPFVSGIERALLDISTSEIVTGVLDLSLGQLFLAAPLVWLNDDSAVVARGIEYFNIQLVDASPGFVNVSESSNSISLLFVPEPPTMLLVALASIGLGWVRRKR